MKKKMNYQPVLGEHLSKADNKFGPCRSTLVFSSFSKADTIPNNKVGSESVRFKDGSVYEQQRRSNLHQNLVSINVNLKCAHKSYDIRNNMQ